MKTSISKIMMSLMLALSVSTGVMAAERLVSANDVLSIDSIKVESSLIQNLNINYIPPAQRISIPMNTVQNTGIHQGSIYQNSIDNNETIKAMVSPSKLYAQIRFYDNDNETNYLVIDFDKNDLDVVSQCLNTIRSATVISSLIYMATGNLHVKQGEIVVDAYEAVNEFGRPFYIAKKVVHCYNY